MTPENNQNLGTKINHSGNAPDGMREVPVNEFDNTSLQDAVDRGLVATPDSIPAENGYTPRTELETSSEKKGFTKKQKIIAALSGVALLAGIGGGIAASNMSGPDKSPVAEAPTDPGEVPSDQETPTPEAPTVGIEWTIDHGQFEAWESMDRTEKLVACNSFFENNPADTDIVPSPENDGVEIAKYYEATQDVIFSLHGDKSDKTNRVIAEKLAECITTVHGTDEGSYRADLLQELREVSDSRIGLTQQKIDNVTRYSDGIQTATDHNGITYNYKAVEYNVMNESGLIPDTIRQAMFEWTNDGKWQKIIDVSSGVDNISYGTTTPPIVLDPTRADAPWK